MTPYGDRDLGGYRAVVATWLSLRSYEGQALEYNAEQSLLELQGHKISIHVFYKQTRLLSLRALVREIPARAKFAIEKSCLRRRAIETFQNATLTITISMWHHRYR